jgi:hypothetical protein
MGRKEAVGRNRGGDRWNDGSAAAWDGDGDGQTTRGLMAHARREHDVAC